MTSQPKKQTIAIQILSNISKSKGNQKMMFGKLIEYNVNITFVHGVSRKMFLMLYSINGPNFIVWLSLLLEILGNICVVIICFPVCDVIYF